MSAALQAAFAPGDCLSSQDNGFSDQEMHRFMFTCSDSGGILHQEWKTSRMCQGKPEVEVDRTTQTEVTCRLARACAGVFPHARWLMTRAAYARVVHPCVCVCVCVCV